MIADGALRSAEAVRDAIKACEDIGFTERTCPADLVGDLRACAMSVDSASRQSG